MVLFITILHKDKVNTKGEVPPTHSTKLILYIYTRVIHIIINKV